MCVFVCMGMGMGMGMCVYVSACVCFCIGVCVVCVCACVSRDEEYDQGIYMKRPGLRVGCYAQRTHV